MVYNPATDFLALWRNAGGTASKAEMPGLDYVVQALARAGLITLHVGAAPPGANQDTTAWLQAAVPSYSAEGVLRLWDPVTGTYVAATAALLLEMLQASAGQLGTSWYETTGGPPLNTVGLDGDFAIRTDEPGGIYGPKAAGAWPADPLPGTVDLISSAQLDATFGDLPGMMLVRGVANWEALPVGTPEEFLTVNGAAPDWRSLYAMFDLLFSNVRGSILYRSGPAWLALPPGVANQVLATGGPGADPSWQPRTAEFPAGTRMLFQQTAAPTGWTKQVVINDYALRVTSGAVTSVAGSPFSAVFAQTLTGSHTLITSQIPAHTHPINTGATIQVVSAAGASVLQPGGSSSSSAGGGGAHGHSINLTLSYVDVIIAVKN
jgi:hypothetical protein